MGLITQTSTLKRLKRLPSRYRLLIHSTFQDQIDVFMEQHESSWEYVVKQFSKIIDSPRQGLMPNLPKPLAGKVCHVHVSGKHIPNRKGFRLIYVADNKRKIILPVYLSIVVKSRFDYDKVPWKENAAMIFKDLCDDNSSQFNEMYFVSR